ncbi:hypothetical protein Hanom_Chr09g00812201 [Helianthus anomalus]
MKMVSLRVCVYVSLIVHAFFLLPSGVLCVCTSSSREFLLP